MATLPAHRRLAAEHSLLPPGVAPGGTRGVILDTALRLIAERGFGGTSVRDIALAAGVQPATLYAHFPSKEHVLLELCRIGHEEYLGEIRDALLASLPDPREQIVRFVRANVLFHTEFSMLAVVCNSELHMLSPELGAPVFQMRRQGEENMTTIIQRGVDQGLFKVPHVWLAAAMIGGSGLRVANWYTPQFDVDAAQVATIYARQALRILGVPDEWNPAERMN
jgi:AcrR family transcriptional regulator